MDVTKYFNIPFNGLAAGVHHFDYDVDDAFFAAFEDSEITGGTAKVTVEMAKATGVLNMSIVVEGTVKVPCDRCLEDCEVEVDFESPLTVKFSDKVEAEENAFDGEVLWLNTSEGELNIARYVYESIVLALPYQKVHPVDADGKLTCDPDMLARFSIVSEEEFEQITAPDEQKLGDNPEFDKLRALKEQLEKEEK